MASTTTAGAGVSANAAADWTVFTGKLPQALKKKLKMVSAETGKKQQEILAEAIARWMNHEGY
ncbi:hypothetical protein LT875_002449 [Salmonella enterica]|nr:hypothetical protein [Salmonella enterica]